ncbi:MAG: hypothetical protein A4E59_02889 [Syntrophorhabdus sp. PtaB.Bin027]|jgi:hypothetical protein|nr:MAG: hypothetical protein A4E59_02889 [Syntrophorhabdus sp. PtaB.Bin027]
MRQQRELMLNRKDSVMILDGYIPIEGLWGVFKLTSGCSQIRHSAETVVRKPFTGGEC